MTMTAARSNATGTPGYSEAMPSTAESALRARALISMALLAWDLDTLTDSACSIVSELVANVVVHTRCRSVRVAISRSSENAVRITVTDTSRRALSMNQPADDSLQGRGLVLVDALSDDWGYEPLGLGKAVWADLSTKSLENRR